MKNRSLSKGERPESTAPVPYRELRLMNVWFFGIILMLKWKNNPFGFVMKNRSLSKGERPESTAPVP